jgi:hypothetical protein
MKVYHGSYTEINEIDLFKCKVGKDFGRGFYVTNIFSQAEVWASRKGRGEKGIVTEYEFDEFFFEDELVKVLRFEGYTEEWLDFVVLNRQNKSKTHPSHDYDIIEGPVADDDIATRINDYLAGTITKQQFLSDLIHKEHSHQICFCTIQSLQALVLQKGRMDSQIFHTDNEVLQALMTDFNLTEIEATNRYYKSIVYTKYADESTGFYKKTWNEIYEILKNES